MVAEWGWPPDTSTATAALGTTAPEGSNTWPRRVPVVDVDCVDDCVVDCVDDGADDDADDCAHAGAEGTISVAEIRIAGIKFAEMKTDKYFNTHLVLSRQSTFIDNAD